jgi:hypothetical protein
MQGVEVREVIESLAAQGAAFEALLLAVSAGHKVFRWSYAKTVVRQFAGLPAALAPAALAAAALGELVACLSLLVPAPAVRSAGALVACGIWASYLALIVRAVLQGRRDVDCGCSFGSAAGSVAGAGSGRSALGAFQVARNLALLGVAIFVAAVSAVGDAVSIQGSQVLAACALLTLYAALDQVMALQPLRQGETA